MKQWGSESEEGGKQRSGEKTQKRWSKGDGKVEERKNRRKRKKGRRMREKRKRRKEKKRGNQNNHHHPHQRWIKILQFLFLFHP